MAEGDSAARAAALRPLWGGLAASLARRVLAGTNGAGIRRSERKVKDPQLDVRQGSALDQKGQLLDGLADRHPIGNHHNARHRRS